MHIAPYYLAFPEQISIAFFLLSWTWGLLDDSGIWCELQRNNIIQSRVWAFIDQGTFVSKILSSLTYKKKMNVNVLGSTWKPWSCMQFIKGCIFYCKLVSGIQIMRESIPGTCHGCCVWMCNKIKGSYDNHYCTKLYQKRYHLLFAIAHASQYRWQQAWDFSWYYDGTYIILLGF